jgi:hypothetical protein
MSDDEYGKPNLTPKQVGVLLGDIGVYPTELLIACVLYVQGVDQNRFLREYTEVGDHIANHQFREDAKTAVQSPVRGTPGTVLNFLRDLERGVRKMTPRMKAMAVLMLKRDGVTRSFESTDNGWKRIRSLVKKSGVDMVKADHFIADYRTRLESITSVLDPSPLYQHMGPEEMAEGIIEHVRKQV